MKPYILALLLTCGTCFGQTASINVVSSNTFVSFTNRALLKTNGVATNLTINGGTAAYPLTNRFTRVPNILYYGAIAGDGLSDDLAIQNALAAAGDVLIPQGTFNINTNLTISATNNVWFERGGVFKPASGVTIGWQGGCYGDRQIFDESAGGRNIFKALAAGVFKTRSQYISSLWWGASPGNSDAVGTTTGLQLWAHSTEAGLATPKYLMDGIYAVTDGFTLSNNNVMIGIGNPQITATLDSSDNIVTVASGANNVLIENITFTSAGSGTNTSAIVVSSDVDWLRVSKCLFNGFRRAQIKFEVSDSILFTVIEHCQFRNADNSVGGGGNGLWPAWAIETTNSFSASQLLYNTVNSCNGAYFFHGGVTNSGPIYITGGAIENCGRLMIVTNTIEARNLNTLSIKDVHFEANQATNATIYIQNTMRAAIENCFLAGDFAGTNYSYNMVSIDGVWRPFINNNRFNDVISCYITNSSTTIPVIAPFNYYDLSGYTPLTNSLVNTRLAGLVDFGTPITIPQEITTGTNVVTTGTAKVTFRVPKAMRVSSVQSSLTTASTAGAVTVDINEAGTTILSTKLSIDVSETTSTTAATAAVISDNWLEADSEITIDVDGAGADAVGLKVYIIGSFP